MLQLTKIFHFEMAHAIHGYNGECKYIHGHSYELQVTVSSISNCINYIPSPGFFIDFKSLKKIVQETIIEKFDHKLILSKNFLKENPTFFTQANLFLFDAEPSAENLLFYISKSLLDKFPEEIRLVKLKLYETNNSYAEWIN